MLCSSEVVVEAVPFSSFLFTHCFFFQFLSSSNFYVKFCTRVRGRDWIGNEVQAAEGNHYGSDFFVLLIKVYVEIIIFKNIYVIYL